MEEREREREGGRGKADTTQEKEEVRCKKILAEWTQFTKVERGKQACSRNHTKVKNTCDCDDTDRRLERQT